MTEVFPAPEGAAMIMSFCADKGIRGKEANVKISRGYNLADSNHFKLF